MLDNFWDGELSTLGEAIAEEQPFELVLEAGEGAAPVVVVGSIDRIDRLPSAGIEVIDYKTGSPASQKAVDESLQLSIYALACRDALGLGTPARVTLYFTESATRMSTARTDEQLDQARADILAWRGSGWASSPRTRGGRAAGATTRRCAPRRREGPRGAGMPYYSNVRSISQNGVGEVCPGLGRERRAYSRP